MQVNRQPGLTVNRKTLAISVSGVVTAYEIQ